MLNSVYFCDENTGYIVGRNGTILKTVNGGDNWDELPSGTYYDFRSVYFTDANTGYAVGAAGTILKTTNGGTNFIEESKLLKSTITIFPNPSNTRITIVSQSKLSSIILVSIFSINGEGVMIQKFQNQNQVEIDVSNFRKGIYLVRILTKTGIESKKLVID
jgi:hypothetical protein